MSNKMEKLYDEYHERQMELREKAIEYLTNIIKKAYSGEEDVDDSDFKSSAEYYFRELEDNIFENSDDLNWVVENQ